MKRTVVEAEYLRFVTHEAAAYIGYNMTYKDIRFGKVNRLQHGRSLINNPILEKIYLPLKIPILKWTRFE